MPTILPESNRCPKCGGRIGFGLHGGQCPRCVAVCGLAADTVLTGELEDRRESLIPDDIAEYFPHLEILEFLGRGGMGVVFKARQRSLNRLVALKILAPERIADEKFAERFSREAQALAALNHPNIVTIYDFGKAGSYYYLLMELVDGVNLRQAMRGRRFTPEHALAVIPPVCDAMQYAHEHGIVHRDVKPENLLLDKEGRVKIADFGIAKMLGSEGSGVGFEESQPAGTPQYMAPEQRSDAKISDHRADIYSLGVVLYEMLTGQLPEKEIEPPSRRIRLDVRLDEIVLRALEKRPELRWQSAKDLQTQVETVVKSGFSTGATEPASRRGGMNIEARRRPEGRRHVWVGWAAAAMLSTLAIYTLVMDKVNGGESSKSNGLDQTAPAVATQSAADLLDAAFTEFEVVTAEWYEARKEAAMLESSEGTSGVPGKDRKDEIENRIKSLHKRRENIRHRIEDIASRPEPQTR